MRRWLWLIVAVVIIVASGGLGIGLGMRSRLIGQAQARQLEEFQQDYVALWQDMQESNMNFRRAICDDKASIDGVKERASEQKGNLKGYLKDIKEDLRTPPSMQDLVTSTELGINAVSGMCQNIIRAANDWGSEDNQYLKTASEMATTAREKFALCQSLWDARCPGKKLDPQLREDMFTFESNRFQSLVAKAQNEKKKREEKPRVVLMADIPSVTIAMPIGYQTIRYQPSAGYLTAMRQLISAYNAFRGELDGKTGNFIYLERARQARYAIYSAMSNLNPPLGWEERHEFARATLLMAVNAVEAYQAGNHLEGDTLGTQSSQQRKKMSADFGL